MCGQETTSRTRARDHRRAPPSFHVAAFQLGLAFSCWSHKSANGGTCKSSSEEMLRGPLAGRRGMLGHQGLPLGKIAFSVTSFLSEVLFSFLTDQWEKHFSKNCLVQDKPASNTSSKFSVQKKKKTKLWWSWKGKHGLLGRILSTLLKIKSLHLILKLSFPKYCMHNNLWWQKSFNSYVFTCAVSICVKWYLFSIYSRKSILLKTFFLFCFFVFGCATWLAGS